MRPQKSLSVMEKLCIPESVCRELIDAAKKAAPMEACGLLAGEDGRVKRFYPLTNADQSEEHFSMLAHEQFAAVKDMRLRGLKFLAIWHSHPASPPRMSAEDLRLAFTPDVVYVILSLGMDEDEAIRGYEIKSGQPSQIEIEIIKQLKE